MSGIRVRSLTKAYGRLRVLHGIDLDVEPGEVVGLIGPNGAGKTTLMSCVIGFLRADGGEVNIDGRASDEIDIRRRTGFVPERMNFDRRASGRAFLRYMAKLAQVPRAEVNARVDALLERLGLADAGKRLLGQYSRGMLQRIGMCQALMREPDFLFLDEPTSGLDPNGVFLVRDLIAEQKQRGAAVLLNSHQLAEVEKVCDRVLFWNISWHYVSRLTSSTEATCAPGHAPGGITRVPSGPVPAGPPQGPPTAPGHRKGRARRQPAGPPTIRSRHLSADPIRAGTA